MGTLPLIGTSGYSYLEWIDSGFYPEGTPSKDMLGLYAARFPVTELNFLWYQMPKAVSLQRMVDQAPPGLKLTAKLPRTLTHEIASDWKRPTDAYLEGIAPLADSGRLAAVLIQLPQQFSRTPANRRYLGALLDKLKALPLAVEFGHRSWAHDHVFAGLEQRGITLATVDAPKLPSQFPLLDVVTNPKLLYFRFHGSNAAGWAHDNIQRQYDYSYSPAELGELAERFVRPMLERAEGGVGIFTNYVRGQAPGNALTLMRAIDR